MKPTLALRPVRARFHVLRRIAHGAAILLANLAWGPVNALGAESPTENFGVQRGLVVILGDAQATSALRLAAETELLVYLQFSKPEEVLAARQAADAQGYCGRRVFIDQGPVQRINLADNLADAVVSTHPMPEVPDEEVLRVLRPMGRAQLGTRTLTKPVPPGIDEWTHPYHGPDNNPASKDRVAKGPYLTQFLADPRYAPLPQAAVAAGGRVFKLFGHIAFKEREEPWLNTLAAFSGYNGALLWRREIPPGINVHRNTFVATADRVYYADDKSCKVLDAATGKLRDEIAPDAALTEGTFWKWMALEEGSLLATVGAEEQRDPNIRMRSDRHGWPWDPLSPAFNQAEHPWGFGRTLLSIDPETKSVRWRHQETEPFDGRATCVRNGRVFLFRHGNYLTCLEAKTGRELWRKTPVDSPELFEALGPELPRQDWRTNWRTTAYTRASDQALYFAGPTISRLVAVSAVDGRLMWQHPVQQLSVGTAGRGSLGSQRPDRCPAQSQIRSTAHGDDSPGTDPGPTRLHPAHRSHRRHLLPCRRRLDATSISAAPNRNWSPPCGPNARTASRWPTDCSTGGPAPATATSASTGSRASARPVISISKVRPSNPSASNGARLHSLQPRRSVP
jgi:outer membrane protein assembly factor BamB